MNTRQKEPLGPASSTQAEEGALGHASGGGGGDISLGGGKSEEAKKPKDPDEVEGLPLPHYLQPTADFSADWCIELFSQICEAVQAFHDKEVFHLSLDTEKIRVFQMPKLAEVEGLKTDKKDDKPTQGKPDETAPSTETNKSDKTAPSTEANQPDENAKQGQTNQPDETADPSQKGDASKTPSTAEPTTKPPITRYTPPELLRGEPPSVRSDIYLLAAIFYEILTQQYFSKPLCFAPEDPRFKAYEWSGLQEVLGEALEDDPLDRHETLEDFWDDLKKTRNDPDQPPPSALQQARKKIQEEMVDFLRKSVTKEALKKTMGWMRGAPAGGGGVGGGVLGPDPTLASEIVEIVVKEIFGMMMKSASVAAKGVIDRKLQAANARRDVWAKRVLRIAGKSLFIVGMVVGMLFGGGTKILSWFRKPAVASQAKPGQPIVRRKKKNLPVTLRLWRYFFPPAKRSPPRTVPPHNARTSLPSQTSKQRPVLRSTSRYPSKNQERQNTPNRAVSPIPPPSLSPPKARPAVD